MIILVLPHGTIYLFSVVPAFSSWQTERKAEIRSEEEKFETIFSEAEEEKFETIFSDTEEEKFETIFSETTADFRNKPGKGHWRVCKGCVGTDLNKVPWESFMLPGGQSLKGGIFK